MLCTSQTEAWCGYVLGCLLPSCPPSQCPCVLQDSDPKKSLVRCVLSQPTSPSTVRQHFPSMGYISLTMRSTGPWASPFHNTCLSHYHRLFTSCSCHGTLRCEDYGPGISYLGTSAWCLWQFISHMLICSVRRLLPHQELESINPPCSIYVDPMLALTERTAQE